MNVRNYTEDNYIPLSELSSFGKEIINEIKEYRNNYVEIIEIDSFHFAKLIETPKLVKKRFIKNVEIKNVFNLKSKDNDFILDLAKSFVINKLPDNIYIPDREKLIKLYKENDKDLTLITNYLSNRIEEFYKQENQAEIKNLCPELSSYEISFIKECNTLNLAYSLNDFISLNATSYETARKSMEKLKMMNLYSKEKISKKFIFRPTSKLLEIIRGGI